MGKQQPPDSQQSGSGREGAPLSVPVPQPGIQTAQRLGHGVGTHTRGFKPHLTITSCPAVGRYPMTPNIRFYTLR